MPLKHIYVTQTNDPQELNQLFMQISNDIAKASEDTPKSGVFHTFDWEEDYIDE
jgi:hypothetical protein